MDGGGMDDDEKKRQVVRIFLLCILRKNKEAEQRGEIKSIVLTLLIKEMREKKTKKLKKAARE